MPYATNTNDDVRIYYTVKGEGLPLLLYPGTPGTHDDMREYGYVDAFRDDYLTIGIDPRGNGQSDKPHEAAAYSAQRLAGDVIAVLDSLEIDRTHFVGYSRGAWVGYGLAKYAPERLLSLTLGGMHPFARDAGYAPGTAAEFVALLETSNVEMPPYMVQRLLTTDIDAFNAAGHAASNTDEVGQALGDIHIPCFIFSGRDDGMHDGAQRAAAEIPTATFLSMHGLDHISAGASGAAIPHIQAFLARVEAEQN